MKKTIKIIAIVLVCVVLAGALGFGCYEWLFKGAEVIPVENGKLVGTKASWLTTANDSGDYLKVADITAPSGYSSVKGAEDVDGDPLTTQFVYTKKDKSAGESMLTVTAEHITEKAALADGCAEMQLTIPDSMRKGTREGEVYTALVKDMGDGKVLCYVPSAYEDILVKIELTMDEGLNVNDELYPMVGKVSPAKRLHPFISDLKLNFVDDNRWDYLLDGLLMTLLITFTSGFMGIILGAIVASIRSTWQKNNENMHPGVGKTLLKIGDKICGVYLTVIRGTPVMVQLLIMYLIIFASSSNGTVSAIIAFGINSGAYVAEIIRGGIVSIDNGQFEAGRSLGFNYFQTMWYIILPQVFKNILPALANEFIALLKETSVSGYVAVRDLNKGGEIIRSVTYSPFLPLLAVAAIYLAMVMFFTKLVSILERRLRSSDH